MMKKQLKKFWVMILGLWLAMGLTSGCGGPANSPLLDLAQMQDEDGSFAYQDVAWGCSPEEMAAQLEISLEEDMKQYDGGSEGSFYVMKNLPFEGERWQGEWQFDQSGCFLAVSFVLTVSSKRAKGVYDGLSDDLEELYGEAGSDDSESFSGKGGNAIERRHKRWSEKNGSSLELVHIHSEGHSNDTIGLVLMSRDA